MSIEKKNHMPSGSLFGGIANDVLSSHLKLREQLRKDADGTLSIVLCFDSVCTQHAACRCFSSILTLGKGILDVVGQSDKQVQLPFSQFQKQKYT